MDTPTMARPILDQVVRHSPELDLHVSLRMHGGDLASLAGWTESFYSRSEIVPSDIIARIEGDIKRLSEAVQKYREARAITDDYSIGNLGAVSDALAPFLPKPKTCPECGQKIEDQP